MNRAEDVLGLLELARRAYAAAGWTVNTNGRWVPGPKVRKTALVANMIRAMRSAGVEVDQQNLF